MENDHSIGVEDAVGDQGLVERAQAGELEAFEALASRYERRVYSVALRILRNDHDAEDVTQQAFLSALEGLASFRGDASFGTWLLRIATHAALKVLRKRKGLDTVSWDEINDLPASYKEVQRPEFIADWRHSTGDLVTLNETRRLLEEALNRLDDKHRPVFVLRDIEGFSVRETAELLGLTEANVKVRLLRARLQLREELTRAFGDPAKQIERGHTHP